MKLTKEERKNRDKEINKIVTERDLFKKTFTNREHHFTAEQFNQVMTFAADEGMLKKWEAFTKKINTEADDFGIVLNVIKSFLEKPFILAVEKTKKK